MPYQIVTNTPLSAEIMAMLGEECNVQLWSPAGTDPAALAAAEGFFCYGHPKIGAAVMDTMPKLRVISNFGVGVDHINLSDARARGIPVLLDGAQAAVHLDVDVQDIGCDFYAFTGHKLYGPSGIGVLYGRHEHLAAMPPFNGGGEMIREVFEDRITYGEPPHKFEAGTPPIVQAIGLGAAIDYVASIGKARIREHEAALAKYAHQRLREINSLRIFGAAEDKGPIVSFELKGAHPHDVATIIDRSGIAVRAGSPSLPAAIAANRLVVAFAAIGAALLVITLAGFHVATVIVALLLAALGGYALWLPDAPGADRPGTPPTPASAGD